ncbi:hypothetical protein [Halorubellus litoreus]|uniref:Uncharacterized protein n=1 Tax=Halorubellus litoreus TaxID=755308 RepID=A0ABD5VFG9_9EURY
MTPALDDVDDHEFVALEDVRDPDCVNRTDLQLVDRALFHGADEWAFDGHRAVRVDPPESVTAFRVRREECREDRTDDAVMRFEPRWTADFVDVERAFDERDDVTRTVDVVRGREVKS